MAGTITKRGVWMWVVRGESDWCEFYAHRPTWHSLCEYWFALAGDSCPFDIPKLEYGAFRRFTGGTLKVDKPRRVRIHLEMK